MLLLFFVTKVIVVVPWNSFKIMYQFYAPQCDQSSILILPLFHVHILSTDKPMKVLVTNSHHEGETSFFPSCTLYTFLHFPLLYIVDRNNAISSFIYYIRLMEVLTRRAKVRIGNIFLSIICSTVMECFRVAYRHREISHEWLRITFYCTSAILSLKTHNT